jgi:hypothetical protein
VNEKSRIMLTSNETSSSGNRGEALKPSTRGLLEALRNRVAKRWVHVDLMQLTVKKSILHTKLRDSPPTDRGHRNKGMNGGPVSNKSKCLLIVTTVLLLKITSIKMRLIALNGAIGASLNLVYPLARDRNSRRRIRNKIPSASTLKSSNLLDHSKLPLRMSGEGIPANESSNGSTDPNKAPKTSMQGPITSGR